MPTKNSHCDIRKWLFFDGGGGLPHRFKQSQINKHCISGSVNDLRHFFASLTERQIVVD